MKFDTKSYEQAVSLHSLLRKLQLIEHVEHVYSFADEPQAFELGLELKSDRCVGKLEPESTLLHKDQVGGAGISFECSEIAFMRCVFEFCERFSCFLHTEHSSYVGTCKAGEISKKFVNPNKFLDFSEVDGSTFRWMEAEDLFTSEKKLIPKQTLYIKEYEDEPKLYPQTTSGVAGWSSKIGAIVHALYELIERDSFLTVYLNKLPVKAIDEDSLLSQRVCSLLETYKRYRLEPYLVDISTDVEVPVYLAVLIDRTGLGQSVSVGAKANLDPEKAMYGALEEVYINRPWGRTMFFQDNLKVKKFSDGDMVTRDDRPYVWWDVEMIENISFMFKSKTKASLESAKPFSIEQEFLCLIELLKEKNFDVFAYDLTPTFLSEQSFYVYRTVIPQLQPLYLREPYNLVHTRDYLIREKRLLQVARYFNVDTILCNKTPHPFP